MKKLTIVSMLGAAFLFVSTAVFSDYSQAQKKIDDKESSSKPVQSSSGKKSDNGNDQDSAERDVHSEGPRDDAAGEHTGKEKPQNPPQAK